MQDFVAHMIYDGIILGIVNSGLEVGPDMVCPIK